MNMIRHSSFVLLVCSIAWAQYHGPVGSGHERKRWAEIPEQRNAIHLSNTPDPRELKRDADELAQLSRAIPAEIEEVSRALVSSNLTKRLKRTGELSNKLPDAVERSRRGHRK